MSSNIAEFSVTLGVSSYSNSLAPALQWYCRQDVHCSYETASLSNENCAKSVFRDMTHFTENQSFLASSECNEIIIEDGSTLFGGVTCHNPAGGSVDEDTEPPSCPAKFYRFGSGRDEKASCPTGTEMVISASGSPGDITYIFNPSPGVEILGDKLPEGCSLVGSAYQCDPGIVTLRFTAAGDFACDVIEANNDETSSSCPIPSVGVPYGQCGGVCERGPDIPVPPNSDDFSIKLLVTSYTNSWAPSLEWSCIQDARCSITAPPQLASTCSAARFDNLTHYTEHLEDLAGSGCNEIVLKDGSGLYDATSCDEDEPCGGVMYHIRSGRDTIASCPSGTRMRLSVAGNPGNIDYILQPTTSAVQLVGDLPDECDFIADGYRCQPTTLNIYFQHGSKPCEDPAQGSCSLPLLGYQYGSCGGADQCSTGPNIIPEDPGDEFQLTLGVTSYSNSKIPSLEWYCRHELPCTYVPDSMVETCSIATSNFETLTDFTENPNLDGVSGSQCHQIILDDSSGLFDEVTCTANEVCSSVFLRYKDGRDRTIACPTGSEMVVTAFGNPGNDYIFNPSEGVHRLGELPNDCVFVDGAYRCAGGMVKMRFTQAVNPCDSTGRGTARCSTPISGNAYGDCTHGSDVTCYENFPVAELPVTTFAPTASPLPGASPTSMPSFANSPTIAPVSSPTSMPSFANSPTEAPVSPGLLSSLPSLQPSGGPSSGPSLQPSGGPSSGPSLQPSGGPSSGPSLQPSGGPSSGPSLQPSGGPSSGPSLQPSGGPSSGPSAAPSLLLVVQTETPPDTPVDIVVSPEDLFEGDAQIDSESLKIVEQPLNGNATINEVDGSFVYVPNPGFTGNDQFTAAACDTDANCVTLRIQVAVSNSNEPNNNVVGDEKKGKEGLYALISLLLAPLLWLFQEPLKRLFDRCFPSSSEGGKDNEDGAATTAANTGVPTSIGVEQTSFASDDDDDDGESSARDESDDDDEDDSSSSDDDDEDQSSDDDSDDEDLPDDESDDTDELFRNL